MRYFVFLALIVLLQSCSSNQFVKRKYTKGVYVAKRSHGNTKSQKRQNSTPKIKQTNTRIVEVSQSRNEVFFENEEEGVKERIIEDNYIETILNEQVEEDNEKGIPPHMQSTADGEVLKKDDHSKKPIIFGILGSGFYVLGTLFASIGLFLGVGVVASLAISLGFGALIFSLLSLIFSLVYKKRGNPYSKIGLILSVTTLALIVVTVLIGLFVLTII